MASWPERFPGRLEYEVEDFRRRGLDFVLDAELLARGGPVIIRGELERDGAAVPLEVVYPDSFPFLRPEVYAPSLRLGRHQNPYEYNLCLLDRSTRAWNPDETGAWLVAERVPYLLDLIDQGEAALIAAEAPQGEPATAFFQVVDGAAIFVPDAMLRLPKTARCGSARLAFGPSEAPSIVLRGLLARVEERVRKGKTRLLAEADSRLSKRFPTPSLGLRWVRLDRPPPQREAADVLAAAIAVWSAVGMPAWERVREGEVAVTAVVFEEEIRQGEYEDGWIFVVQVRDHPQLDSYTIRGERLSAEDLGARVPHLRPLREKTVALTGAGALGAPLALELARARLANLRTLDYDLVEVGNTVRWPLGLTAVGRSKTRALQSVISADYPYTDITAVDQQIGAIVRDASDEAEMDVLTRFLDGADLLIDATAEISIGQLLSSLAADRQLPQLYVWATEGAWGGAIARVLPGQSGCWFCLQLHLDRGSIPIPPREPSGSVQPRGCATPTFTGASFDLLPLVAQAARVAAHLLVNGDADRDSDVHVLALVDDDGHPSPAPHWTTFALRRHPECPLCATAS